MFTTDFPSMYYPVGKLKSAQSLTRRLKQPATRGCLGSLASSISVTLVSRLNINLQQPAAPNYLTSTPADVHVDRSMMAEDDFDDLNIKLQSMTMFNSELSEGSMILRPYGTEDNLLESPREGGLGRN
jgi:hypothetical protein